MMSAFAFCLTDAALAEVTWQNHEHPRLGRWGRAYCSNEGEIYDGFPTADGIVLTSAFPKSWYRGKPLIDSATEMFARTSFDEEGRVFFDRPMARRWTNETAVELVLKGSCVAVHSELGKGSWRWSEGNFIAEFSNRGFTFENQELIGREKFMECKDHD